MYVTTAKLEPVDAKPGVADSDELKGALLAARMMIPGLSAVACATPLPKKDRGGDQ
jgi:hypothetical protein